MKQSKKIIFGILLIISLIGIIIGYREYQNIQKHEKLILNTLDFMIKGSSLYK